jgi:hypothetical protein
LSSHTENGGFMGMECILYFSPVCQVFERGVEVSDILKGQGCESKKIQKSGNISVR